MIQKWSDFQKHTLLLFHINNGFGWVDRRKVSRDFSSHEFLFVSLLHIIALSAYDLLVLLNKVCLKLFVTIFLA